MKIELLSPRYELFTGPTPLQRIRRTEQQLGFEGLYVKRDDQMEVGLGGNKLRSLEFWLAEALQQSADIVLVAGEPMSNQCRLSAIAAAMAGIECIVFHNADENSLTRRDSFLNRVFGASVRFLGCIDEKQRTVEVSKAAAGLKRLGRNPYIIGNPVIGALGYVLAAEEINVQSRKSGAKIRHVILPGSMGPTEAGFIFGNALLGYPFDVHLISVEYDQAELTARIQAIYQGLCAHTGLLSQAIDKTRIHYHMDYLGDGYGKPDKLCEQAILHFARTEGIMLEHTYTGKTFAGFLDLVQRRKISKGEAACVIHTGGVPALFSQFDLFKTINW